MSENKPVKSRKVLIYSLLSMLVGIAGVQTWYILEMKHDMEKLRNVVAADNPAMDVSIDNQNAMASQQAAPSVSQQIQKNINAQMQHEQGRAIPGNPPSLFDDDFFNQPLIGQNWNPYEEIQRMRQHMDRVFHNAFDGNNRAGFNPLFRENTRVSDIKLNEDDSEYTITMSVPNADEKNISINLEGQRLTVKGEQDIREQKKDAMGNVIYQEHHTETFQRSISLPGPVKQNGMITNIDDGVLKITVPKLG